MNTTDWLTLSGSTARLALHIQPGAKKTSVAGPHGDALKIRLAAPPVDGKANAELLGFLAKACGVPRSAVGLDVQGEDQAAVGSLDTPGHAQATPISMSLTIASALRATCSSRNSAMGLRSTPPISGMMRRNGRRKGSERALMTPAIGA